MKTYNAADVTISYGVDVLTGLTKGTFVEIEQDEDDFMLKNSVDGEPARSENNITAGKVTVTLDQWSDSNAVLSAARKALKATGGTRSLIVKDKGSQEPLFHAAEAWIQKIPKQGRGQEMGTLEWVFIAGETDQNAGGVAEGEGG